MVKFQGIEKVPGLILDFRMPILPLFGFVDFSAGKHDSQKWQ